MEPYQIRLGDWFFSFYTNPAVWGLNFHHNAPCCKWWLVLGPFEINRVYANDEEYYSVFPEMRHYDEDMDW